MKRIKLLPLLLVSILLSSYADAQTSIDSLRNIITRDSLQYVASHMGEVYARENQDGISTEKLFEIMIPSALLLIFFIVALAITRINANKQLKIKMIDRGISEETLIAVFNGSRTDSLFSALKWALVLAGIGFGLAVSQIVAFGMLTFGIISFSAGMGFFLYYLILKRKA